MPEKFPLIASYWTVAGDAVPLRSGRSEISPHPLPERIAAAAAAGFTGFGFSFEDLNASIAEYGLDTIAAQLREHGIVHVEVEMLSDWFADGEARVESDRVRTILLEAARALGARHLKCGGPALESDFPLEHLAREFATLCDDAAAIGINVAIEPMPFTAIRTPADGLELVQAANRANGGLCIDIWHVARSGTDYSDVAKIPQRYVVAVEINDADSESVGDLLDDTLDNRKPCGEGDLNVVAFIAAIRATGFDGPYGVEIISKHQRSLTPTEGACLAYETAVSSFESANALL